MTPEDFPQFLIDDEIKNGAQYLKDKCGSDLDVLIVLGSGLADTLAHDPLGDLIDTFELSDIPGVMKPIADGHLDQMHLYQTLDSEGKKLTIAVALGRTHLYEGHGPDPVTALAKICYAAGVKTAILCNANGCLREWELGDVVAIDDHLNFTGTSPFNGTFFTDISATWDQEYTEALSKVCQRRGNYAIMRGPEYQTMAETRFLHGAGVDCVGMSTVMEALMLHALGVRVCGMSVVSDLSFSTQETDPHAVVEIAARAQQTIRQGIDTILAIQ
ncbi:MAG: purine-nucleoside phosphorylase [Actinomycetaceae bacterium]|nr:purine-nucleoside phosphorylase [Actinomycetaceae bacterium]